MALIPDLVSFGLGCVDVLCQDSFSGRLPWVHVVDYGDAHVGLLWRCRNGAVCLCDGRNGPLSSSEGLLRRVVTLSGSRCDVHRVEFERPQLVHDGPAYAWHAAKFLVAAGVEDVPRCIPIGAAEQYAVREAMMVDLHRRRYEVESSVAADSYVGDLPTTQRSDVAAPLTPSVVSVRGSLVGASQDVAATPLLSASPLVKVPAAPRAVLEALPADVPSGRDLPSAARSGVGAPPAPSVVLVRGGAASASQSVVAAPPSPPLQVKIQVAPRAASGARLASTHASGSGVAVGARRSQPRVKHSEPQRARSAESLPRMMPAPSEELADEAVLTPRSPHPSPLVKVSASARSRKSSQPVVCSTAASSAVPNLDHQGEPLCSGTPRVPEVAVPGEGNCPFRSCEGFGRKKPYASIGGLKYHILHRHSSKAEIDAVYGHPDVHHYVRRVASLCRCARCAHRWVKPMEVTCTSCMPLDDGVFVEEEDIPAEVGQKEEVQDDLVERSLHLEAISARGVSVVRNIPPPVVSAVEGAWSLLLRNVADNPGQIKHWLRLLSFAPLVLVRPARRGVVLAKVVSKRLEMWKRNEVVQLYEEFLACAKAQVASQQRPAKQGEEQKEEFFLDDSRWLDVGGVGSPASNSVTDTFKLVSNGLYAQAASRLRGAKILPMTPSTVDKLKATLSAEYPDEQPEELDSEPCSVDPKATALQATAEQVKAALYRFKKGSAPGPDGMKADHLKHCATTPGNTLLPHLTGVVNAILRGEVPHDVRPLVFGFRLIPFAKKSDGVRPIACGTTLRRLAAKLLAQAAAKATAADHLAVGQVAIGVGAGIDAAQLGARLARESVFRSKLPRRVFVKLDFSNFFSALRKESMVRIAGDAYPPTQAYLQCAYGGVVRAYLGGGKLLTADKGQQGDPLLPYASSAVGSAFLRRYLSGVWSSLDFRALFLDDWSFLGTVEQAQEVVRVLQDRGPVYGMFLNVAKCEVYAGPDVAVEDLPTEFAGMKIGALEDGFEVLGGPVGPVPYIHGFVRRVLDTVLPRVRALQALEADPHKAYALHRFALSQPLVNFLMRSAGSSPEWSRLDDAAFEAFTGYSGVVIPDHLRAVAQLPAKEGGLGLRSAELHSAGACLVASAAAEGVVIHLFPKGRPEIEDPLVTKNAEVFGEEGDDCLAEFAARHPEALAAIDDVREKSIASKGLRMPRKAQKHFSALLDDHVKATELRAPTMTEHRRIAVVSASAPRAAAWMAPAIPYPDAWLTGAQFACAIRLRMGLEQHSGAHRFCAMCGKPVADRLGEHTLKCMSGGGRAHLHHSVVRCLEQLMRESLLNPRREHPITDDSGERADIVASDTGVGRIAYDVAIVSPFAHTTRFSTDLLRGGFAAAAYEPSKVQKYRDVARRGGMKFSPLVFETFGGWAPMAEKSIGELVKHWAARHGVSQFSAAQKIRARVSAAVLKGSTNLLLKTHGGFAPEAVAVAG